MKVIHISSSDLSGGAAIAAFRINKALNKIGVNSRLLVQQKSSDDDLVKTIISNKKDKVKYFFRFFLDELLIRTLTVKERGRFSVPYFGGNVATEQIVYDADIINLHWVNGGFLSLNSLSLLGKLNKPIVWTLHDMWAFTGGCHYNLECLKFVDQCNNCPSLKLRTGNDLSSKIFNSKKNIYSNLNLTIATCSNWLAEEAKRSTLLKGRKAITISNPIDTKIYMPIEQKIAQGKLNLSQDRFYLLIGAMNLKDKRKGFRFLVEALKYIHKNYKEFNEKIEILTFGKLDRYLKREIPYKKHQLGKINNEKDLVYLYNSADLYIAPSLQDNLPNTVLESISCGTPVVAFKVGGITDMITHNENGYLAELKSSKDLANGIVKLLSDSELLKEMGNKCRQKTIKQFEESKVANQYLNLYQELLLK